MWSVRPGHDHNYVDGRTHVHHIHLYNSVTGGEHNIEILLGCPSCPSCKRPYLQSGLHVDPAAEINSALETLANNHRLLMGYVQQHGHPIRVGPHAHLIPTGFKTTTHGEVRLLHAPRPK